MCRFRATRCRVFVQPNEGADGERGHRRPELASRPRLQPEEAKVEGGVYRVGRLVSVSPHQLSSAAALALNSACTLQAVGARSA